MRLSSAAGAGGGAAAVLALGATSALLWEAWAALGTRFLGAAAPEPLHATRNLRNAQEHPYGRRSSSEMCL